MPQRPADYASYTKERFKTDLFSFQFSSVKAYQDGNHVIVVAPTGKGKSVPPVANAIFGGSGLGLIVSALNVISAQLAEYATACNAHPVVLRGYLMSRRR